MLARDNIELIHCPIERMIANYFTKLLQGSLFRKIQDIMIDMTTFSEEDHIRYTQNMSLRLSGSSIDPGNKSVIKHSMGMVSTEGSKI